MVLKNLILAASVVISVFYFLPSLRSFQDEPQIPEAISQSPLPPKGHSPITEESRSEITFGISDWCPYTCLAASDTEQKPRKHTGILVEWIRYLSKELNFTARFRVLPFQRSLSMAEIGQLDAITGLFKNAEREEFLIYGRPLLDSRTCFFGSSDSDWRYQGTESLTEKRIGLIDGYSYGEFDSYIAENPQSIFIVKGESEFDRLFKLMESNRIDLLIEDDYVGHWQAKRLGYSAAVKRLGCGDKLDPIYIGSSMRSVHGSLVQHLINKGLKSPKHLAKLQRIKQQFLQ